MLDLPRQCWHIPAQPFSAGTQVIAANLAQMHQRCWLMSSKACLGVVQDPADSHSSLKELPQVLTSLFGTVIGISSKLSQLRLTDSSPLLMQHLSWKSMHLPITSLQENMSKTSFKISSTDLGVTYHNTVRNTVLQEHRWLNWCCQCLMFRNLFFKILN